MFGVKITDHFKKELKPYAKKFPAIINDIESTLETFNPDQNAALGGDAYKI